MSAAPSTRERPEFRQVYFIEAVGRDLLKIGCADNSAKRLATLQVGSPDKLELLGVHHVDDAVGWEAKLHKEFGEYHHRGEWFRKEGRLAAYVADNLLTLDQAHLKIVLRPQPYVAPVASIYTNPGESPRAFSRRLRVWMSEQGIPA